MKLILLQKVVNLGGLGDTVVVKPGYGRNYLVPAGKAVPATASNVAQFEAKRAEYEAKANDVLAGAQSRLAGFEDASVTISANTKPIANAGADKNAVLGTLVTLSGSASSDPDGDPLTYKWTLTSKPAGSAAVLNLATTVAPTFTPDLAGSYVAKLVVKDGKLNSIADSIKVMASAPPIIELAANGGFETPATVGGQFALGWRGVNSKPATLATEGRTGTRSASLAVPDPGFGGSGLAGNSVDDGGQLPILGLHVGKLTRLTFWAKGSASTTGNVNFSLRYLNSIGAILNPVVNTSFGGLINTTTWTKISLIGPAIPAATSAMFLEMTLAAGPTGVQPPGNCGVDPITGLPLPCDYGQAKILIDDISIEVLP